MRLILNKNAWLFLHLPPDKRICTVSFRCAWSNMMSSFCSVSSSETMISGSGSGPRALLHISCLLLLRVGVGGLGGQFSRTPNVPFLALSWLFSAELPDCWGFLGPFPWNSESTKFGSLFSLPNNNKTLLFHMGTWSLWHKLVAGLPQMFRALWFKSNQLQRK